MDSRREGCRYDGDAEYDFDMYSAVPSFQKSIWDIATDCAYNRLIRKCKEKPVSIKCNDCELNVYNYTDIDKRAFDLLMYDARRRARSYHTVSKMIHKGYIFSTIRYVLVWVGICGFVLLCGYSCYLGVRG
ncbi:MAG: hypothetical protein LBQ93_09260 [Treponema sp.]|jgi:hypothetical protein|nr:hypothetical protein [Treponema sp.]